MIKIGVCGFGTVGQSFVNHVITYKDKISKNCGQNISISLIADRSIHKKKFDAKNLTFSSDVMTAINSDCDLIVELIGGTSVSYNVVKEALKKKRVVVS